MARVFDGVLHVGFHQAMLYTPETSGDGESPEDCFQGQVNGLCGAMMPGTLMFITGLHSGRVSFTVDVLDGAAPLDSSWEEAVEVSFLNDDEEVWLCDFDSPNCHHISLAPGTYRVRYCCRGMDRGSEIDTLVGEDLVDFYALTFWPAPVAPDAVLKQTSVFAAVHHQMYK